METSAKTAFNVEEVITIDNNNGFIGILANIIINL